MTTLEPDNLIAAGELLRAARGRRQISLTAKQVGVSEAKYEAMERGFYPPSSRGKPNRPVRATVAEYTAAAHVVGVPVDELLTVLGVEHTESLGEDEVSQNPYALAVLLRDRRVNQKHMSQRQLLAAYGRSDALSPAMLSKYEKGVHLPMPDTVPLIARIYDLPVEAVRAALQVSSEGKVDVRLPARHAKLSPPAMLALIAHADLLLSLQEQEQRSNPRE